MSSRVDRIERTGVITSSLAHELRLPMTSILSNAQAGLRFDIEQKMPVAICRAHEGILNAGYDWIRPWESFCN